MSVNLRYPNISGFTEKEQIAQIKSYLHQLVEELNYALPNIGSSGGSAQTAEVQGGELSYYELRSLIVQQIQEIEAMFDQLEKRMESGYVKDEELPAAVNAALEQAKESGEFDGADGKDGQDGKTPVYGVDFTLTEDDVNTIVTEVADKISFTLDEDGNLYYEVEE